MKISVVIEATSIQEYTEAIQALAAGYTVAPQPSMAEAILKNTYAESKQAIEQDTVKVSEEKPKRSRKAAAKTEPVKEVEKPDETSKEDKSISREDAEKLAAAIVDGVAAVGDQLREDNAEKAGTPNQTETSISFVDVKLKAKQLANLPDGKSDVKFILEKLGAAKLSDLTEDQYSTFMEMAEEVEKTPKVKQDDAESDGEAGEKVETGSDSGEKEAKPEAVTLGMIRSRAKELSVAGLRDEIKKTLTTFKAKALTAVKESDYEAFYKALGEING